MTAPLKIWLEEGGRLLRLRLDRPKANIVDAEMIAALDRALAEYHDNDGLLAVLLDAEGPHFSFGASVEEHLPANCKEMLESLHGLLLRMAKSPVPILVAVQGQCLGGGLELAMGGHLMFAAPDAKLGQPEIKIGVFAPAASCLLIERVGRARAEDLLFSGRSIGAAEACQWGLVNEVADDPAAAALAYFNTHFAPLSGSSLRFAVRASRLGLADRLEAGLRSMETLYIDGLMETRDALEGLESFVEKRPAKWRNR